MEERSETTREDRRRSGETSRSHVDDDTERRADTSDTEHDQTSGDFTQLRERGDRKGGSTSSKSKKTTD